MDRGKIQRSRRYHRGSLTTFILIAKQVTAPYLHRLVEYLIKECYQCRRLKLKFDKAASTYNTNWNTHLALFGQVVVDTCGPLVVWIDNKIYRFYFLVIVCSVSRAVSIVPIEGTNQEQVYDGFLMHFGRHGTPVYILMDRLSAFRTMVNFGLECFLPATNSFFIRPSTNHWAENSGQRPPER